jgi:uncharacterized protein (TIGR02145 family)
MQQKRFLTLALGLIGILAFTSMYSCKKNNPSSDNTVTYDGYTYHTVKIGSQTWMVENFRASHFTDGLPITHVITKTGWNDSTKLMPARCYYGKSAAVNGDSDSSTYASTYGALYNFAAISNPKFAPEGWSVPDTTAWNKLIIALGGNPIDGSDTTVGSKLKEKGVTHWSMPDAEADDSFGFTALPAGQRGAAGLYDYFGFRSCFWSSSKYDNDNAYYLQLFYNTKGIGRATDSKFSGFSIRLVRNN